jgi:REP element-mobilizing transposase RayT
VKISGVLIGMRKPRNLEQGARYHIIARINRQEMILEPEAIKDLLLAVLVRAKAKHAFEVTNLCIMSNHVHFIIRPREKESLSCIMQWLLSVFAILYNKRLRLKGHVWYDRFKSYILGNLRQFLRTFMYISDNPVNAGIVKRKDEFKYSGIWFMKRGIFDVLEPPDLLLKLMLPGACELREIAAI